VEKPKQAHAIVGNKTMFQYSVERLLPLFGYERILVVAVESQKRLLSEQVPELPRENFIIEPEGRGTAPCIGLAAINILEDDPDATMVVVTADHHIRDVAKFREALKTAINVAEKGYLVTLGIQPSSPSTGYGYIKQGNIITQEGDFTVYKVERFIEKPGKETARKMVSSGDYSWNSGMFIWRVERIMGEFQRQMPNLHKTLEKISETVGTPRYDSTLEELWGNIEKQTIDYGVMEEAERVAVIPLDIGWSDIGSWSSLVDLISDDERGNVVKGNHVGIDTSGSLIYGGERLVATIGLEDMIIVDTGDVILICPKGVDQRVRDLVHKLREKGFQEYL
jgi:mannose-1-phosphate guanylyltransferase